MRVVLVLMDAEISAEIGTQLGEVASAHGRASQRMSTTAMVRRASERSNCRLRKAQTASSRRF